MRLHFKGRSAVGDDLLDTGIKALAALDIAGATMVLAATGAGGGLSVRRLRPDGTLELVDSTFFGPAFSGRVSSEIAVLQDGGTPAQVVLGASASGLFVLPVDSAGRITDRIGAVPLKDGPGAVATLAHLPGGRDGDILALAGAAGGIGVYRVAADGWLEQITALPGQGAALALAVSPGGTLLLSAGALLDQITGVVLDDAGRVSVTGTGGPDEGLGMDAATALHLVAAHGQEFAILAAAGSSSLSVLQMQTDGTFVLRDHLIDSRSSRFAAVQDIAVAEVAGQVFVVAGGGDDGINLLTLLPDGRLVHLDAIANGAAGGLSGITRLSMTGAQDALQVLAATQGDAGLAHLTVPMAGIGAVIRGGGTLTGTAGHDLIAAGSAGAALDGGAGDDILVAGLGGTTMTGGEGADLFVLQRGGGEVRITDFNPQTDRLDLSDFGFLRSPDQLTVVSRERGARITFRDEDITLDSHDGSALARADLFGPAFEGPDRFGFMTVRDWPAPPGDTVPAPPPAPDPEPATIPVSNPPPNPENDRLLVIDPDGPNAWLGGARLRFSPDDAGPMLSVSADALGRFDLSAAAGQSGILHISRGYSPGDPAIDVADALDILRLAVGLAPSFGPATPHDLIAADLDRDGAVTVADALDTLRFAVGLDTPNAPEWLFLDATEDPLAIPVREAPPAEGIWLTLPGAGEPGFETTAILLGNVDGWA
jgi:Ca2+-binding RTX toxin-like protein